MVLLAKRKAVLLVEAPQQSRITIGFEGIFEGIMVFITRQLFIIA